MKYKFLEKLGMIFLAVNVKTISGQALFITDLANGGNVEVIIDGEKQPLPDGNWELENGKTILVKGGIIEDVVDTVPVDDIPEDQTETTVEGNQPTENVEPSEDTEPSEDIQVIDMPAEEVISATEDVVENVVTAVVEAPETTLDEVTILKTKVDELTAKLAELTAMLEEKGKALNMATEKLETTISTKKDVKFELKSSVSEADKNKYWYKKLNGLV